MAFALMLLPFAGRLRALRRRLAGTISLLLLAVAGLGAMAALSGCGATSGLFADQAKTYTVTVTATSGTLSHATSLTLTVK
jgi:large repetitive protein